MAFPDEPLDVTVELNVDGDWTDITDDTYSRDPITIQRGEPDAATSTDPGKATLTINNRDGQYSPKNPRSPLYGKIGRNTPVRISVPGEDPYMRVGGDSIGRATTPDSTDLHVDDEIDIRIDLELDNWNPVDQIELAGRYDRETDNRSWLLSVGSTRGELILTYSPDGLLAGEVGSIPPIPVPTSGRVRLRATLAFDGEGGATWAFYTADSMAGPWTQFYTVTSDVGVTGMFGGTADLQIGDVEGTSGIVAPFPPTGTVYAFQFLDGIDGTALVDVDFTAQTVGDTSFTDDTDRVWTLSGDAEITDRQVRFAGEISSWPPKWDVSGKDVWVPVQASGILRRLGQGAKPFDSTLRRRVGAAADLLAYWPMEDGRDTTQAYSPLPGVAPLKLSDATWASDSTLPGSLALPKIGQASVMKATVPAGTPGNWHVEMVYNLAALPSTEQTILALNTTNSPWPQWRVTISSTAVSVYGGEDTSSESRLIFLTNPHFTGQWNRLQLTCETDGSDYIIQVGWIPIGEDQDGSKSEFGSATVSGDCGRVTSINTPFGSSLAQMPVGHLSVFDLATTLVYNFADHGFTGETAGNRFKRLAREETIPMTVAGPVLTSEPMGPQPADTILNLLGQAAESDGGILYEALDSLSLRYRTRETLYNQTPALTLDYSAGDIAPGLEPVEDDTGVRNDRTVTRAGGSSARAVLEEGALSTQAPPDGVGIYNDSATLSLGTDAQAKPQAYWRLHMGTIDEARYPQVAIMLHAKPDLVPAVLALREGDLIRLTNLPDWLPPGPVDLMYRGIKETLSQYTWDVELNCTPAAPWRVGVVEDTDDSFGRADTDGSELGDAVEDDDTTLTVTTTVGSPWTTDEDELPFDIVVGGEQMTVSAVEPYVSDTFTRTASSGWGTADSGQAWTAAGGSASNYSVSSGSGVITLASSPSSLRAEQILEAFGDCDIRVSITPSALATGAAFAPAVLLRASSDYYLVRVILGLTGSVGLALLRVSTEVGDGALTSWSYTAGTTLWIRVRIVGQRVQARVWPSTEPEPVYSWHLEETVTDDPIDAGAVGVVAMALSGNTNSSPAFRFDGFEVLSPQKFTVTRSVNGISKSHSVGADVRLAYPAIVAL